MAESSKNYVTKFEMKEMVEGIADRLQRIEAMLDLLVTKKGEKGSEDGEVSATKKPDVKAETENPFAKDSSSSGGGNGQTISVTGFDPSLPLGYIESELTKYFGSFGEITRVFVPADTLTGISLGYAYIDMKEGAEKALELGVVNLPRGGYLVIGKAEPIASGSSWPYPGRCGNQGRCTFC